MAQAILLQDVEQLGVKGDVVDVASGYLRNYLAPRSLAQPATDRSVAEARRRIEHAERELRDRADRADENAALLTKTVLTIEKPAGEDGKLFGSVTTKDIAAAIQEARGIRLDRKDIQIDESIKHVGTYSVTVQVYQGVHATVKTIVAPAE